MPITRKRTADDHRQHLRLVEHEQCAIVIFLPRGVRHQRRHTNAKHLRDREHDEGQVAGDADPGDRFLPQPSDPVEIDQEVKRLKHHRDEHEPGRLQQMARERTSGQVLHAVMILRAISRP